MIDSGLAAAYRTVLTHSCPVKAGETVVIETIDVPPETVEPLVEGVLATGGIPLVIAKNQCVISALARHATPRLYNTLAQHELMLMKGAEYFIGLRAIHDFHAMSQIPVENKDIILKHFVEPVHYRYRNEKMRYVYFRIPTEQMAENAQMTPEEFIPYYYQAVNLDYSRFARLAAPLRELLDAAETVRIIAPGTDLAFKITKMAALITDGRCNLPDCEVMTAPVLKSATGKIRFNIPSTYYGTLFENICLEFEKGAVVRSSCDIHQDKLAEVLGIDNGAVYCGEFALGLNPAVTRPVNDILFDEKMHGSIHLALGNSYPGMDNGNRSAIHWDMILAMTAGYGGGRLYLDDALIQEDGVFMLPELQYLNRNKLAGEITLL